LIQVRIEAMRSPFVWHENADEILDSLVAYCRRINDSGH
jgi:hypothetical protein